MTTQTDPIVYPVWKGQNGPEMLQSEVDQRPVVLLPPNPSVEEIEAAERALACLIW